MAQALEGSAFYEYSASRIVRLAWKGGPMSLWRITSSGLYVGLEHEEHAPARRGELGDLVSESGFNGFGRTQPQVVMVQMLPLVFGEPGAVSQDSLSPSVLNAQNFRSCC